MTSLEEIAAGLLEATGASRVTIRVDTPGEVYPVAAEALAPGVRSIRGATEIDLRKAETFKFLDRERRTLVQCDCLRDDPAVPPELIELYGVRAQILVPVVSAGGLAGIVSVHHAATVREWTAAEVAATEVAAERVARLL